MGHFDSRSSSDSLIVVSNRLPVTIVRRRSKLDYKPSAGGLATAMAGIAGRNAEWIGWPGIRIQDEEKREVAEYLFEHYRAYPVYLTSTQIEQFYNRFCNGVLWPLFHYLPEYTDFDLKGWSHYRQVNELFAESVASRARPDATIWIHDYHLMLLPRLLREKLPEARIGFFLHIPFPTSEVYRLLPVRNDILEGLLGADVVGFHTHDYARHFNASCVRILGCDTEPQFVQVHDRQVRLSVHPIGIDVDHFRSLLDDPGTQRELRKLRRRYGERRLILGVDRLDYSKGLVYKLEAYRRFLEQFRDLGRRCVFLQVAVPSRTGVKRYRALRREIEELVGNINGLFSSVDHTPVQFLFQSVSPQTLSALYRLADVCWVSSIRDGMNLVCQEYVASQTGDDAVLVLSEFAGAAHALQGALQVNPWNVDQMAGAVRRALEMSPEERRARLAQMQAAVSSNSAARWAHACLQTLECHTRRRDEVRRRRIDDHFDALSTAWEKAARRFVLLDEQALRADASEGIAADEGLVRILHGLRTHGQAQVYLLSDSPVSELEESFGALDIALCAERGCFLKRRAGGRLEELVEVARDWMPEVLPVMREFEAVTPGAEVEARGSSVRWNWRGCDPGFGRWQANELAAHLNESLANMPVEVVHLRRAIEVRPQGVSQGVLSRYLRSQWEEGDFILAIGVDSTDEDLFSELPEGAWTCRVGERLDRARFVIEDRGAVVDLLGRLIDLSSAVVNAGHLEGHPG